MDIDDKTAAYILETEPLFEDLRQVAVELAGLLLLAVIRSNTAAPDHPMLAAARTRFDASVDRISRARSPAPARRHHRHLEDAAASIGSALVAAAGGTGFRIGRDQDIDGVLRPLRAGYASLERASRELPGFTLVTFEQACCAIGIRGGRSCQ
jgi:hypothetical protein